MDVFTLYDENPEDFEDDYGIEDEDPWEEDRWWDDRTWSIDDNFDEEDELEDMPEEEIADPISEEVQSEFSQFEHPSAVDEKDLELN